MKEVDRRQFFRTDGEIFLHIATFPLKDREKEEEPEALDQVGLRLMNYRARLAYERPAGCEPLLELADILLLFHKMEKTPPSVRTPVRISGSSLEFPTGKATGAPSGKLQWYVGEPVTATMTFPEYPFATVTVNAKVARVDVVRKKHWVTIHYPDINESDRDLIIKYVNHLQRKHRIAEKIA